MYWRSSRIDTASRPGYGSRWNATEMPFSSARARMLPMTRSVFTPCVSAEPARAARPHHDTTITPTPMDWISRMCASNVPVSWEE